MPNVYLEVLGRQSTIRRIALKSSITVGRQKGCKLRIPSRAISRQHCRIELTNGHVSVTDLGSSNGTWVNGERIQAHTPTDVEDASKLAIGNEKFRVIVQRIENLDATIVDQNLFPTAVPDVDLGSTILDQPPEATLATEPEIESVETSDVPVAEAAPTTDDVIPIDSDVTPVDHAVAIVNEDDIAEEPAGTATEFDIAELDDFDLLADEEEPVAEAKADSVHDEEPLVTENDPPEKAQSVEATLKAFEVEPVVEEETEEDAVASIDSEEVAAIADLDELALEGQEASEQIEPEPADEEPFSTIEAVEEVLEVADEPAEHVQGSLFELEDDQPKVSAEVADIVVEVEAETPQVTRSSEEIDAPAATVEEAAVVADTDDEFGFGVDEDAVATVDTDMDESVTPGDDLGVASAEGMGIVEGEADLVAEVGNTAVDEEEVAIAAEVVDDEFVSVAEDDTTESLEFLVEEQPAVEDNFSETADSVDVAAPQASGVDEPEPIADLGANAPEVAFLPADDDQIDAEHLSETVAEAVAVDESASVLSDTVQGDSVLDLDEEELPIAEYVGDDEVPVAALVEDAADDIPNAIEIEEVHEVAAAIIDTDEEEAEVIIAEQAEEDDDSEFELVAEEDDDFDVVDEAEPVEIDPLATTMMMTEEMQAVDPQSIDTGFSVGGTTAAEDSTDTVDAIVEPVTDEAPAEQQLDDEEIGDEDSMTIDADVEVDDDSDVVPVATTEPPKKKGGLFGWLNIFKRRKKTKPEPQIIDDLDNESGEPDVVEGVDEEDTVVDGAEGQVEPQLIMDADAFATIDDEDDATIVEDLNAFDDDESADEIELTGETEPVTEVDLLGEIGDEDEELTAVDRSQFADDDAPVAAGSDEDDAMDFLSDDGEDMAASFLGENEPTPAKADDSDFEDFFADIKD